MSSRQSDDANPAHQGGAHQGGAHRGDMSRGRARDGVSRGGGRSNAWRARLMHAARIGLVVALLIAIPEIPRPSVSSVEAPPLDSAFAAEPPVPADWKVVDRDPASGLWQLSDGSGEPQGWAARTLPAAKEVVGYRGPTEALIVLSPELTIESVSLLSSEDTEEHVAAVERDADFFEQFRGWTWTQPQSARPIDGVSGATLTSLALAEGMLARMGGSRPSLRFPDQVSVDEVLEWFPEADSVDDNGTVFDANQKTLGKVLRTGPLSDGLIGYQGPTELLLRIDEGESLGAVRIRRSYDNEPYVGYVKTEYGFWPLFTGKTIEELAAVDPDEPSVEGVSGATMTSQTVADTIHAAARAYTERLSADGPSESPTSFLSSMRWTWPDVATCALLVAVALFSQLRWFHHQLFRRFWLLAVVAIVGFWSGNLISMALIAGWSAEGIAWRLAPGLTAIVLVALSLPPISKGNPYCNHLCPHGALQQLLRPGHRSRRRVQLSPRWARWLTCVPGLLLATAYITLVCLPSVELSSWEPFHAYLFRIAPWGSIALAILSLVIAAVIPMGYCRMGCPTGRFIDYIRLSARSDRFTLSDMVAIGLLGFALVQPHLMNG